MFFLSIPLISRVMQVACSVYQRKRQKEREKGREGERDRCMEAGRSHVSLRDWLFVISCVIDILFLFY